MNNEEERDNSSENNDIEKSRYDIIFEIIKRFDIVTLDKYNKDDISSVINNHSGLIHEIRSIFKDITIYEVAFILRLFKYANESNVEILINLIDTLNSLFFHYEYYKNKNPNIKYNNSHFDNYLLKRYESAYIFTTYISDHKGRDLKIDNKLYFNYIPTHCDEKHNKANPIEIHNCGFAHNDTELKYHPFVYKKFKCVIPNCKQDDDCYFYHEDEDGKPIDMETDVEFDSFEIKNLKNLLSSSNFSKKDKNIIFVSNEKSDFIPTEFNPSTYKMYRCPLGSICKLEKRLCLNYHDEGDRRRNPNLYKAKLCPNLFENNKPKKGAKCNKGDNCDCAHNLFEYFYHKDKFRKFKCREENEQEGKRCKYRLICPYSHETDVDCGENDEKFKLDPDLISNYYKSLMVNYKKSIDSEMEKVNKIKNKYACYKCGLKDALEQESFLIDNKEHKIICQKCCDKNRENYTEIKW